METEDRPLTKKRRLWVILLTAKANDKWESWKHLRRIASKGYISRLLNEFKKEGLIERRSSGGIYFYRASEKGLQGFQNLGILPRSPLMRKREHLVQLRPVQQFLDVDSMWMEHQKLNIRLDAYTADVLRKYCEPARRSDRAQQRSFSNSSFVITISKHNHCALILKEPNWKESLVKWMLTCGISQTGSTSVLSMIQAQMPESLKRVEMPVLDPSVRAREMQFAVTTNVGDAKVISNINYSTNIDFEVYGQSFLVDQFLATLGATQHNQVVVMAALKQEVADLSKKVNELQKEREAVEKKKADESGGTMYV